MKKLLSVIIASMFLSVCLQAQVEIPEPPEIAETVFSGNFFKVSKEEEAEYLKNLSPKLKKEMLELKQIDEKAYNKILWKTRFNYSLSGLNLGALFSNDKKAASKKKEMSELELYTQILGAKIKHAGSKDREAMSKQLRENLNRLFDLKQENRNKELGSLREKITELSKSIEKRQRNKNAIIQRRIEELTGESEYLKWK